MRRSLIALTVVALAGSLSAQASSADTRTVRLGDDWFVRDGSPTTVTVSRGDKVRWRWTGRRPHNVQVQRGPARFQSAVKRSGTYAKTLRTRGTYRIVCSIHRPDMRMTLVVR